MAVIGPIGGRFHYGFQRILHDDERLKIHSIERLEGEFHIVCDIGLGRLRLSK